MGARGCLALISSILILSAFGRPADVAPKAWWKFEEAKGNVIVDAVTKHEDSLHGYFDSMGGVTGKCIRFDGQTTCVARKSADAPVLVDSFSMEAWVAPQTYAWDWTAIMNREKDHMAGFFFGIDVTGHVGLHLAIDGKWVECNSPRPIPLLKWSHLAATFDKTEGVRLYINGEAAGSLEARGSMTAPEGVDLFIGKNLSATSPRYCEAKAAKSILSDMVFDGLIDEVKIYDTALNAAQVQKAYSSVDISNRQPLQYQLLPTGPGGTGIFGAYYTRLNYSEQWDRLRRIGDVADIVVRFDDYPVHYMFWNGTNYGGVWVTENGRLMGDQSLERSNQGKSVWGCPEHMSDKQARYSSIRILESNDARAVIHWRYALTDIKYNIFGEDPETGWGEWAEEFYYIYPDAIATRHQILWSKFLSHEWQETIILNQPGTYPEDNVENEALTLANLKGETQSFSWVDGRLKRTLEDPTIQMVRLKSSFRPVLIFQPRAGIRVMPGVNFAARGTHYLWWNHWPVAQIPSDGTEAHAPDKPSHTSLGQGIEHSPVVVHDQGKRDFSDAQNTGIFHDPEKNTFSAVHLTGLTDRPIAELLPLARSWNFPAEVNPSGDTFTSQGYDKVQRAYLISRSKPSKPVALLMGVAASPNSPLINPAFVIRNWGDAGARLMIDGKEISKGKDFRIGRRNRLDGTDLIVWIKIATTRPVTITLNPAAR